METARVSILLFFCPHFSFLLNSIYILLLIRQKHTIKPHEIYAWAEGTKIEIMEIKIVGEK